MRALSGIIWNLVAVSAGAVIFFGINSVSLSKGVPSDERDDQDRLGSFSDYLAVKSYLEKERVAGLAQFKKEKQLAERERQSALEAYRREKSLQVREPMNAQKRRAYQEHIQERFRDYLEMEQARRGVVAERQSSQGKAGTTAKEIDEYSLSESFPRVDWGRRGLFSNSTGFSLGPRLLPNREGGLTPPFRPNDPHGQWSGMPPPPPSWTGSETESVYPPASAQPIDPQNWNSPYLPVPPSSVFEDEEPPF